MNRLSKASSLPILFLVGTLIFHQFTILAGANETLIKDECKNAEVPIVCEKYVEYDARSKTADRVGIAGIIIDILGNLAGNLVTNITSYASTFKQNSTFQVELEQCAKGYAAANITGLPKSKEELRKGNYDEAESLISEAITQCESYCYDPLVISQVEFPADLSYDIHVYEDLTNAAQRIIERF